MQSDGSLLGTVTGAGTIDATDPDFNPGLKVGDQVKVAFKPGRVGQVITVTGPEMLPGQFVTICGDGQYDPDCR